MLDQNRCSACTAIANVLAMPFAWNQDQPCLVQCASFQLGEGFCNTPYWMSLNFSRRSGLDWRSLNGAGKDKSKILAPDHDDLAKRSQHFCRCHSDKFGLWPTGMLRRFIHLNWPRGLGSACRSKFRNQHMSTSIRWPSSASTTCNARIVPSWRGRKVTKIEHRLCSELYNQKSASKSDSRSASTSPIGCWATVIWETSIKCEWRCSGGLHGKSGVTLNSTHSPRTSLQGIVYALKTATGLDCWSSVVFSAKS